MPADQYVIPSGLSPEDVAREVAKAVDALSTRTVLVIDGEPLGVVTYDAAGSGYVKFNRTMIDRVALPWRTYARGG